MSRQASRVFYGFHNTPKLDGLSLGELFYRSLKIKDLSEILMVDYSTGEEVTRLKFIQSTLRLSRRLHLRGIVKKDTIAIISTNTWKFLIPVISSFFLGTTVTALNPNFSEADLLSNLSITKPKVIFASKNVLDKIIAIKNKLSCLKHVVIFDGDSQQEGEMLFDDLTEGVDYSLIKIHDPIEEAIILYTSGTTEFPKGVIYSSQNVKTYLSYTCDPEVGDIGEDCILLGVLPQFHALGLITQLACVVNGKRCIILDEFKPEPFLNSIKMHKITNLIIVPTIMSFLAKDPLVDQYDMTSVREIMCGVACLGKEIEDRVSERLNIKTRQIYGLTEAPVITCTPKNVYKPGSVGKVIKGHDFKIVDLTTHKTLRENQNGEIWFKGPGVMRGYKNNGDETKKMIDSEGFLHTGDVGYSNEGCYYYIMDRLKELIKYKGFQVIPAQLEDLLLEHPAVKDAGVVGTPDESAGELPTAFIVKEDNLQVTEEEIIAYIADKVSVDKQLHGGVKFINEIPKLPCGKILRSELRRML